MGKELLNRKRFLNVLSEYHKQWTVVLSTKNIVFINYKVLPDRYLVVYGIYHSSLQTTGYYVITDISEFKKNGGGVMEVDWEVFSQEHILKDVRVKEELKEIKIKDKAIKKMLNKIKDYKLEAFSIEIYDKPGVLLKITPNPKRIDKATFFVISFSRF